MTTQREFPVAAFERSGLRILIALILLVGWACSGGDGCDAGCDSGCDDLFSCDSDEEVGARAYIYPDGAPLMPHAVQVHLTERGLDFVGDNLEPILNDVAGLDGGLSFCVPERQQNIGIGGNADICMNSVCDNGTPGCELELEIVSFKLMPVPAQLPIPTKLRAEVILRFERGLTAKVIGSTCIIGGDAVPVRAEVDFEIDPTSRLTRIYLDTDTLDIGISGIQITGQSITDALCSLADMDMIKDLLGGLIDGQLSGPIDDLIGTATCERCSDARPCPAGNTCEDGVCIMNGTDRCLGLSLGMDGLMDMGEMLSSFAPGMHAEFAYSAWLADYVDGIISGPGYGFDLGMRAGFVSPTPSLCVPLADPPTANIGKSVGLHQARTPNDNHFAVGVGVARPALNLALWGLYQSGVLCIEIGAEEVEQLTTSLFALLLPSLSDLTGGSNHSMDLALRPNEPPTIELGRNIVRDGEIEEALLFVVLNDLDIDFSTQVYDRTARIFTLNVDLRLPLAVQPEGEGIRILLGDLTEAFTRVEGRNANLLSAEDVSNLSNTLPTLLGAVAPMLTSSLEDPIEIPEIEGFRLVIREDSLTSVDDGDFLAIFADLELANAPINPLIQPITLLGVEADVAHATDADRQRFASARLTGAASFDMLRPEVIVNAQVLGAGGHDVELSWRVNGGFWSRWSPGATQSIDSDLLALDGEHLVEVRARVAGMASSTAAQVASFEIVTDHTPPTVEGDWLNSVLRVSAVDELTTSDSISIEYRVDSGAWRAVEHTDAEVSLDLAAELAGRATARVEVRATDAAGNSASEFFWKHGAPAAAQSGCAATGGAGGTGAGLVVLFLALLALRRRSLLLAAVASLALVACGDDGSKAADPGQSCQTEDDCAQGELCVSNFCVNDPGDEDPICTDSADCSELSCEGDQVAVCTSGGDCACEAPCPNGCGDGTYCCETSRTCEQLPDPCAELSCEPGTVPELEQVASADGATCEVTLGACSCVTAPALPFGYYGLDVSAASSADGSLRVVSAQNITYRDLLVGIENDAGDLDWHIADGVPADALATGDVDGPRAGVSAIGEELGRYSSVAVGQDGSVHLAYYVRTGAEARSLRYARGEQADGEWSWSSFMIDDATDAGRSSALFLDDDDHPIIAYAVPRIDVGGTPAVWNTEVRLAAASEAAPASADDFEITTVDTLAHVTPCGGTCSGSERCRLSSNRCEVRVNSRLCDSGCSSSQECFADDGGNVCDAVAADPAFVTLTQTIGLHISGLLDEDQLELVYYDAINGNLLYNELDLGDLQAGSQILDGQGEDGDGQPIDLGDVGRFPAIARAADGRTLVAYHDASEAALMVMDLDAGTTVVVDAGDRDDGVVYREHKVGGNPRFFQDGDSLRLYYGDSTSHHIYEAIETAPGVWEYSAIAPSEADSHESLGFFLAGWQDDAGAALFSHRIARGVEPVIRDLRQLFLSLD